MTLTVFYRNTFVSREINPEQTVWFLTINDKFKWISPNFWHLRNSFLPLPHSRTWVPLHLIFCGALTKGSCAERGLNKPSQVSLVNQAHVFTFFFFLMRHKEARIKHRMVFIYVFQIYIFCFYKAPHPHAFHIQQKQHSELEIKDGNCFYSEITFGHFLKRENIKMQVAYRITSEITSPL